MTDTSSSNADRVVLDAVGVALSALPPDARVAIGFSGGLDSSVLLDAAVRVAGAARVVALHVHHGLSSHADEWLAHCETSARACGAAFAAERVDMSRTSGVSVEAAARDARYRALDRRCDEHGVASLWLAQHADDQAETVLLQLLRGAGLAGLAAMGSDYRAPGATVPRSRPLLRVLRAQLEQYATGRGLRWIDDESNDDTRYARNALRHDVMPTLAVRFPGFRDAFARTAAHAASAQRLLDELARLDLREVAVDANVAELAREHADISTDAKASPAASEAAAEALRRDALLALDDERASNLLRYWMRSLGMPAASAARLADALRQLRELGDDHAMRVDHAGQALRCYRGVVYWEAGDSAEPADETALQPRAPSELRWRGQMVWHLPQWRGSFVFAPAPAEDREAIDVRVLEVAPLVACSRKGGERMRRAPGDLSRTLKNLFQRRGIPAWRRDVPLLYAGERLLFVPELGLNADALEGVSKDQPDEARGAAAAWVRIEWRPDLTLA
ncbi:tRNA lysidine(34) synthetase TilS [Paraburkholderia phosphatilytica]|uniref:tRNA lysidine(34) synthetase TilS n=1 Tax=Paraburkholderia phosphatilytica TaxID=2282883 RepID=UPI000E4E51A8|nr:tRNA lysidine(34) synthetase TilS [Paraburkholderia phosphatilytica]